MNKSLNEMIKATIRKDIKSIETWSSFFIVFFIILFSLKKFDNADFLMYVKVFSIYLIVFIVFYFIKCYRKWKKYNNKQL